MIQIANPIYDVVFKYLMEDTNIAILLISSIIEEEIEKLELSSQEMSLPVVKSDNSTLLVYRLDFKARIKTPEGTKDVLIEIQKAKFATDIERFRRYLGHQYLSVNEKKGEGKEHLPIITIYFLGYHLEHIKIPVIKVLRHYTDIRTGEEIKEKEHFIESLTHDSYVIQIPYLEGHRSTELEILLSIFDQSSIDDSRHILRIRDEEIPKKYSEILRRLQWVLADDKMRRSMDLEDEILEELKSWEREKNRMRENIEKKDKVIEEKEKVIEEKNKVIDQKDKVIEENKRLIEELKRKNIVNELT